MDETKINEPVPYIVYESERARAERLLKDERERHDKNLEKEREDKRAEHVRSFIIIIVLLLLFVGSNLAWIIHESQYVDETWTYEATTDNGGNAIVNGDGEVTYNGESESNTQETNP